MQPRFNSLLACSALCCSFLFSGCFLFPQKPAASPCATNNGGCSSNATCSLSATNTVVCACNGGFVGNGMICNPEVTGPCAAANCDPHASCTASGGTAVCTCNTGYVGNGTTCIASSGNPCSPDPCDPNATCADAPDGGPACTCKSGFSGDGFVCVSTGGNPCAGNPCGANSMCTDNGGSAQCTCDQGYTSPTGNGLNCQANTSNPCQPNPCGSNSMCTNNGGSAQCTCDSGYTSTTGDGMNCIPNTTNPCQSNPCGSNSTCTDNGGTAQCTCNSGFTSPNGNGTNCVASGGSATVGQTCTPSGSQGNCSTGEICLSSGDAAGDTLCTIENCTADSTCGTTNGLQNRCWGTTGSSLCLEGCTSTTSNTCPTGFGCALEFDVSNALVRVCDLDCVTAGGCGYGETCNATTHGCEFKKCTGTGQGNCPTGDVCVTGQGSTNICVPNCNTSGNTCPTDTTCQSNGACTPTVVGNYGSCTTQANCESGYTCVTDPSTGLGACLESCTSTSATCASGPTGLAEACNVQIGSSATDLVCTSTCTSGVTTCPTGTTCTDLSGSYFCLP